MKRHVSESTSQTHEIASKVLKELPRGNIICLYGQLGAGKTTFTKGLALAMGITEQLVKSPTYTYVREIESQGKILFHCDLYRLEGKPNAANEIISELIGRPHDVLIIEWAEFLEEFIPKNRTDVHVRVRNEISRDITVQHHKK